ncbi:SGNH/GDSL hydrolase family protein [Paraburkholderia sp. Ac-20340]|uniref:SGNH/GDSL hydrolase family protein n=1 Tax=Paraburkholderia sp. Ac-20340 TaxID=2703888 RepID=UPI001982533B|nr:SGNH/GDSL hydrolase family protein [Paraburkholderia sp. Ac-20340]MBN3851806.1 SGNH/GDSL hydrolase family protein [Paraburkholderia sp. Ac-20340]
MTILKKSRAKASAALVVALAASGASITTPAQAHSSTWVATWQASPQPVWGSDFLFPANVPQVLRDQTVRQVARISVGGRRLRIVLSNAYGSQPVTVGKATVARAGQQDGVTDSSARPVTFGGREMASIAPGASLVSDPVALPVSALAQVTVSIYLPDTTPMTTFHWDGRQSAWIVPGDQSSALALTKAGGVMQSTTARLLLTGIDVETESAARAVVVIGDSITDGAAASLNQDSRWPDFLAARLAPDGVAVVNAGISGARLLSDGMGVSALARLDRDVLTQPGVGSVIVMLGINDIAWPGTAFARTARRPSLDDLTAGYRQLIEQAHRRGLRVIGATLTPFEGALPGTPLDNYYDADKDALRQRVNDWIRHSGVFDAVIDFDAALRDPVHPQRLAERYDSGDHLHPGDAGNRKMAEFVDLGALIPQPDAMQRDRSSEFEVATDSHFLQGAKIGHGN